MVASMSMAALANHVLLPPSLRDFLLFFVCNPFPECLRIHVRFHGIEVVAVGETDAVEELLEEVQEAMAKLAEGDSSDGSGGSGGDEEVQMRIPLSLGPPREDLDKDGGVCTSSRGDGYSGFSTVRFFNRAPCSLHFDDTKTLKSC